MRISFNVLREGSTLTVELQGRVDATNAMEFDKFVKESLQEQDGVLVFDFADLNYISSAGIRVLILVAKNNTRLEGKLGICSPKDSIRDLVEVSGLNTIYQIFPDRQSANAALGS